MQQISGTGSQSGTLSFAVATAGFYNLGLEADAVSIPSGSPGPQLSISLIGGNPSHSAGLVLNASKLKTSASVAGVYLEPGDSLGYAVAGVHDGAESIAWTLRAFVYDQGSDLA